MAQTMTLTYEDGRTKAFGFKPPLKDLVEMEHRFGISSQALANGDARVEWIAFLIWQSEKRNGEGREFEDWLSTVVDLDMGEAPDPTPPPSEPQPA